ncbi:MAG TPA: hypothetical protein DHV14_09315 [Micrococcales bacterium]|uniref:SAF domain-containing protein n=1 Tax=Miniimonas arenae TaxID=676201 RepID=UPI000EB9EAA1|nr:SAF domain-containing protein [Miniimonas arenae]HCX85311.1 hypothetical protein [Micrococcales bacterium]
MTSWAPADAGRGARARRRAWRSRLWRYRPLLVGALVATAILTLLPAVLPTPPETSAVVVAAADLPAGTRITPADVEIAEFPPALVPAGARASPADLVGSMLAHPAARGTPVLASQLAVDGWTGLSDGELAVPVHLADPAAADLLPDGATVHLVSATGEGASVLTSRARVLARIGAASTGGLLGGSGSPSDLLLVAVPSEAATLVLDASAGGTLTVALGASWSRPGP